MIASNAYKTVGKILYKVPGFLEWRLSKKLDVSTWTPIIPGQQIEVMVRTSWLEGLRQDDGRGKITGMDREGRREAPFVDMFISKLNASTVLLDVGAGYGVYSVIAAHKCQPKNIHSFEPDPICHWILRRNNKKYCDGQLNIDPRFISSETKGRSVTLDDYCAERALRPTLIKMDIEGAEIRAVAGMRRICQEYHPVILMEFHMRKVRNQWKADPQEVLQMLRSYGYRLRFNGHHWHLVQFKGQRDPGWHDTLPNDVNCAVIAEAEPRTAN